MQTLLYEKHSNRTSNKVTIKMNYCRINDITHTKKKRDCIHEPTKSSLNNIWIWIKSSFRTFHIEQVHHGTNRPISTEVIRGALSVICSLVVQKLIPSRNHT